MICFRPFHVLFLLESRYVKQNFDDLNFVFMFFFDGMGDGAGDCSKLHVLPRSSVLEGELMDAVDLFNCEDILEPRLLKSNDTISFLGFFLMLVSPAVKVGEVWAEHWARVFFLGGSSVTSISASESFLLFLLTLFSFLLIFIACQTHFSVLLLLPTVSSQAWGRPFPRLRTLAYSGQRGT